LSPLPQGTATTNRIRITANFNPFAGQDEFKVGLEKIGL